MQKLKIKLNRSEQDTLLAMLLDYDLQVFDDEVERRMIQYLGGEITRRVGKHLAETFDTRPWTLKLNHGEAAALQKIFGYVIYLGYADILSQKILVAVHKYFADMRTGTSHNLITKNTNQI